MKNPETAAPIGIGSGDLLAVLGEDAQAKHLTAEKTNQIMRRDNSRITGFVVTDSKGNVCIVDKAAVRWMTKAELWRMMHKSASNIIDVAVVMEKAAEECRTRKKTENCHAAATGWDIAAVAYERCAARVRRLAEDFTANEKDEI